MPVPHPLNYNPPHMGPPHYPIPPPPPPFNFGLPEPWSVNHQVIFNLLSLSFCLIPSLFLYFYLFYWLQMPGPPGAPPAQAPPSIPPPPPPPQATSSAKPKVSHSLAHSLTHSFIYRMQGSQCHSYSNKRRPERW